MRQRWFVVLLVLALSGLVAMAAEKPPDSYQKAMKDLGTFATEIDKAVTADDFDQVSKLAVLAREAFAVTEAYWKDKSAEAAEQALSGYKSAADLNVVAGYKNKEGVAYSAMEVKNACGACHTAHRERQPDGTFLIK